MVMQQDHLLTLHQAVPTSMQYGANTLPGLNYFQRLLF